MTLWEIDPHQHRLLGEFVVNPKERCERVAQDMGVDTLGAKDVINRIISDPEWRHPPQHGWVSAFEVEVHRLIVGICRGPAPFEGSVLGNA